MVQDRQALLDRGYALGKTYYCHECRNTQDPDAFNRATFLTGGNGYANACIGCAHFDALKNQSFLSKTSELVEWQRYGLASAMYAYDNFLQFSNPCEGMVAFLKACAPIAYTDYGKAISHYGGLRIAPWQAIEYAGCASSTLDVEELNSWHGIEHTMQVAACATSATMTLAIPSMLIHEVDLHT